LVPPLNLAATDSNNAPDKTAGSSRIAVLDILRGLALLIMVIAHVADETGRGDGFG
jgi:uncharacterized membrane protein